MAYVFEDIKKDSPIKKENDYLAALSLFKGGFSERIRDSDRDISYFCYSVNSNREREPGGGILYVAGEAFCIRFYLDTYAIGDDKKGYKCTVFDVLDCSRNKVFNIDKSLMREVIEEYFMLSESRYKLKFELVEVIVDFSDEKLDTHSILT